MTFFELRRRFAICVATLCVAWSLLPAKAYALTGEPALTEAQAALICDQAGNVLYELNPELRLQPASITKIMTAMVALDSGIDLDASVTVVAPPPGGNSQTAGYAVGDVTTMRELMLSMIVYSGNDAALNVACIVAGSEEAFVDMMNAKAAELGMDRTHFINPHGLETEGHLSCVSDLVKMGRYAMENYPFIAESVRREGVEAFVGGELVWLPSTDDLMETYEGLLGIKTGGVESGTAFLGASQRGTVTLYTAVLGCATEEGRFVDTAILMDWAYDALQAGTVVPNGWTLRMSPHALCPSWRCPVVASESSTRGIWEGSSISYRNVNADRNVLVETGDSVGALWWRQQGRFAGGGALIADSPLMGVPAVNVFELPVLAASAA